MAAAPLYDRVMDTTTTTGTGTLTLSGTPVAGYQAFSVIGNGNTTPIAIWAVDANGNPTGQWETATDCTYTSAGTTVSRGTFQASSTGSAVSFSAGTKRIAQALPAILLNQMTNAARGSIYGLELTYTNATAFGASAGFSHIESGESPIAAAALADLTGQTGTSAHFYNVFEFLSGGVPTLEKVDAGTAGSTNVPVAFALPAGTARSKTSDPTRRWLGSVLWGATDTIRKFQTREIGRGVVEYIYLGDTGAAAPFNIVPNSSATSLTAIDMSPLIPNNGTAVEAFINIQAVSTTGIQATLTLSLDSSAGYLGLITNPSIAAVNAAVSFWCPINSNTTTALYYKLASASTSVIMYCWAYRYRR